MQDYAAKLFSDPPELDEELLRIGEEYEELRYDIEDSVNLSSEEDDHSVAPTLLLAQKRNYIKLK